MNMAQSEKHHCPICKQKGKEKTTFICQDSGCFCSVCGYKGEKGSLSSPLALFLRWDENLLAV